VASGLPDFRSPIQIAASALLEAAVTIAGQENNLSVSIAEAVAKVDVNLASQVGNLSVSLAEALQTLDVNLAAQSNNISVSLAEALQTLDVNLAAQTSNISVSLAEVLQTLDVNLAAQTSNISVSLAEAVAKVDVNLASQVGNLSVSLAEALQTLDVNLAAQAGNISVSIAEALQTLDVNLKEQVGNIAVQIADQIGDLAMNINSQTLAAVNTDYRYGTSSSNEGSVPIDDSPITLLSITGKGIIFGGSWIIDRDEAGVAPGLLNNLIYVLDGEPHEFRELKEAYDWNLSIPGLYQPAVTLMDAPNHRAAGSLPGGITFEESFELVIESTDTSGTDEIDARIFHAISL